MDVSLDVDFREVDVRGEEREEPAPVIPSPKLSATGLGRLEWRPATSSGLDDFGDLGEWVEASVLEGCFADIPDSKGSVAESPPVPMGSCLLVVAKSLTQAAIQWGKILIQPLTFTLYC